jgi:transglutaminase-like putative cysteine protease
MDLHAWFEAFVGDRCYTFDATQKKPRGNRIVVAYGRDAADVAQMSDYGPVTTKSISVWVKRLNKSSASSDRGRRTGFPADENLTTTDLL